MAGHRGGGCLDRGRVTAVRSPGITGHVPAVMDFGASRELSTARELRSARMARPAVWRAGDAW